MKMIEIKKDGKIIYKIVPNDYKEPEKDIHQRDLTTSDAKYIGYSDVPQDKWNRIFGSKS